MKTKKTDKTVGASRTIDEAIAAGFLRDEQFTIERKQRLSAEDVGIIHDALLESLRCWSRFEDESHEKQRPHVLKVRESVMALCRLFENAAYVEVGK